MSTDTTTKMKLNTTTLTTKASVLVSPRTLNLTSRSIPPPLPTELQISIRNTGLCGSDLHYHTHFSVAGFPVVEPLTLEHEASGVITAMGSSVPWFEVGDRVALEVGIPCTSCDKCKEGRYNICKGMKFRSSARTVPHFQGTLQEVLNHEAKWCHKLPVGVSLEEGALVEPLSVGLHAVRRSGVDSGKSKACLVIGAGTIGLMTAAVLRARGVQTVVMADLDEKRIWFAAENGFADRGILVERQMEGTIEEKLAQSKDIAKKAGRAYHWGSLEPIEEFDVVFECTGVESCVQTAIYATRPGGKVLLVGIGPPTLTLPMSAAAQREVDLVGVFRYASTYPEAIEMIAASTGRMSFPDSAEGARPLPDLKKLITHRFQGLESVQDAFKMASSGVDGDRKLVLKVMIEL